MSNKVDISVYVLTYFHEKYIKKSLDSIFAQETSYSYEIIVSDDASTDGTQAILKEYQNRYPDIIKVNYNEVNLGIPKNIFKARSMCSGKYIVALSGDDYWTNVHKLQIQAKYLDEHPECFGDVGRLEIIYENNEYPKTVMPKDSESNMLFTIRNFEDGQLLSTHGIMLRNEFLTVEGQNYFKSAQEISDKVDDAVDVVLFLRKGPIFVMPDIFEVYRSTSSGNNYNSIYSTADQFKQDIELYNNLYKKFGSEIDFKKRYILSFTNFSIALLKKGQFNNIIEMYHTIPVKFKYPLNSSVLVLSFKTIIKRINTKVLNKIVKK